MKTTEIDSQSRIRINSEDIIERKYDTVQVLEMIDDNYLNKLENRTLISCKRNHLSPSIYLSEVLTRRKKLLKNSP